MPDRLPIFDILPDVKKELSIHNTLILQAPPGAGKSTIVPLELLEENWLKGNKILLLEPRRLAARATASRMANLHNERLGDTVGYRIRFDNRVGPSTRIECLTEGILTRKLQQDNALEGVGLVIFDEFHERSLHADLGLVLCRQVQEILREDLRILIMSATLDTEALSDLLDDAPVLKSKGRQYPVDIRYENEKPESRISEMMAKAIRRAIREEEGDILAFFPGTRDIRRTVSILEESVDPGISLHPLYGNLPLGEQEAAIQPHPQGKRKVVLATSIAETSLTIEGINIVVDSGFARVPRFDPRSGLTRLETVPVTLDAADQRAGRAGRLGPGVCYRLWTMPGQRHLKAHRKPEIMTADLAPLILELAHWGIQDVENLAWPTPPPTGAVGQARDLLHELEALEEGKITTAGKDLLRFPTHPRLAHMLLIAKDLNLEALAADIAALLEERDPLKKEAGADLSLRVDMLRKWRNKGYVDGDHRLLKRIERLALSWRKLLKVGQDNALCVPPEAGRLLAAAYPERIAKQSTSNETRYKLANLRTASLFKNDPLLSESWLAVAHLDAGAGEGRIFLAAPFDPTDLEIHFHEEEVVKWDEREGKLIGHTETRLGKLVVGTKKLREIPKEKCVAVLCGAIRNKPDLLPWTNEVENLQARMLSLRLWRPEEAWPDLSREALIQELEAWLGPYLMKVRRKETLQKLNLVQILKGLIPWEFGKSLEELAPTHVDVPSGSRIRLTYAADGGPPILAVRLQEVFGLMETPIVNGGRMPVMVHLLSPASRPLQVTQDLGSFWKNTYSEVRKEMRGRYPKHYWPEDPYDAEAIRGVRRKKRN